MRIYNAEFNTKHQLPEICTFKSKGLKHGIHSDRYGSIQWHTFKESKRNKPKIFITKQSFWNREIVEKTVKQFTFIMLYIVIQQSYCNHGLYFNKSQRNNSNDFYHHWLLYNTILNTRDVEKHAYFTVSSSINWFLFFTLFLKSTNVCSSIEKKIMQLK